MPGVTSGSLEGRGGEVYRKWAIYRWTQERIAAEYGISHQRVSQIIAAVRANVVAPDRDELIAQSREALQEIHARFLAIADQTPAPLVAGKDGLPVKDPETGQYVRDYSARMKALAEARATDAEIAKRFGLSAPDKQDVNLNATVRYEIAGVDEDDLT